MLQYNIIHAEDHATSLMEDPERFAEMFPDFIAACRDTLASDLEIYKVEDLPGVIPIGSRGGPMIMKILLELMVERYEAEIELLSSQEISYEFRDPRAFLESLLPLKMKKFHCSSKYKKQKIWFPRATLKTQWKKEKESELPRM